MGRHLIKIFRGQDPNFELLLRELKLFLVYTLYSFYIYLFIYFILSQAIKHIVKVLSEKNWTSELQTRLSVSLQSLN